jgi:hypothetical protein
MHGVGRRSFLRAAGAGCIAAGIGMVPGRLVARAPLGKVIPSSGETLPVIGMGTWINLQHGAFPGAEGGTYGGHAGLFGPWRRHGRFLADVWEC